MPNQTIQNVPEWAKPGVTAYVQRAWYMSQQGLEIPEVFISAGSGAIGKAQISGGGLVGIEVVQGGTGYLDATPPSVELVSVGGTGFGATATCTVVGGVVTSFTVTAAGSDYDYWPQVAINTPGSGAKAHAHLTGDAVSSITVDAGGAGYTAVPAISILGGSGVGATAHAHLTLDAVTSIDIDNGGSGYGVAAITFAAYGGTIIAPQNANELAGIAALAAHGTGGNLTVDGAYDLADDIISEANLTGLPAPIKSKINLKGAAADAAILLLIGKSSSFLGTDPLLALTLTASSGTTIRNRLLARLENINYHNERASMDSALGMGPELAKQAVTDAETLRKAGFFGREYLQYTYELTNKLFTEGQEINIYKLEIFGNALRALTGSMSTSTQDMNSASGLMQAVGLASTAVGIYSALNAAGLFTMSTAAADAAAIAAGEAAAALYTSELGAGVGGVVAASSKDFKENVRDLTKEERDSIINQIQGIKLYNWQYKPLFKDGKNDHMGLMTEEAPGFLVTDDGKHIDILNYLGALTAAVQILLAERQ